MKNKSLWIKAILVLLVLCGTLILAACGAEETGKTTKKNKVCKHEYGAWVTVKEPTCSKAGEEKRTCKLCKETQKVAISTVEHKYGEWEITAANCSNGEVKTHKCTVCKHKEEEKSEVLGYHEYVDYTCKHCKAKASKLVYTKSEDEKYYIVSGMGECKDTEVVVMDIFEKLPVTVIADNAFAGCDKITKISLPETITEIGAGAFDGCKALAEIVIPKSVTSIGAGAFAKCDAMATITLPFVGAQKDGETNTHFGYIFGAADESGNKKAMPNALATVKLVGVEVIPAYAFSGCNKITAIELPEGLKVIGNNAFSNCDALAAVTIPATVEEMGNMAFYGCDALATVTITDGAKYVGNYAFANCVALAQIVVPQSIEAIGDSAFKGCIALKTVTLEGENLKTIGESAFENCTAIAALAFNKGTETIQDKAFAGCTALASVTFSESIKSIGDFAFSGCVKINKITITKNITIIGESAFAGCAALETVELETGAKLTVIEQNAFADCAALKEITSGKTESEWNAITKLTDWDKNAGKYEVKFKK